MWELAGLEEVLYARGVLEVPVCLLERGNGVVGAEGGAHLWKDCAGRSDGVCVGQRKRVRDGHVMVVFTRPTFASRAIFAKSVANSGESCIFSRRAREQRGDWRRART